MNRASHEDNQKGDAKLKSAMINMFPSKNSCFEFKNDAGRDFTDSMETLIDFAKTNELIADETEAAFLNFIETNRVSFESTELPEGYSFSKLLNTVLGERSVNSLIVRLNGFAKQFKMMPVQASMFSRLKTDFNPNTRKKRNLLRLFAFWLGFYEPQLGWHYEMLLKLPRKEPAAPIFKENEGVRIAFSLQAAGDILDHKAVEWLKKELRQCIQDINLTHIGLNKISFTLSTAYLDLPKAAGPSGEPRLYAQSIRAGLALAYQMSIRWSLSEHSNQQRAMIIAITAGPFDQAEKYIQALLSAKMSGITTIRVTDFVRLCAKVADVKVIFSQQPEELDVGIVGMPLKLWHVDCFWTLYFDFVTSLLQDDMLPTSRESYEKFKNALFFPDQFSVESKALAAIRKFPKDSLLVIEIARVLIIRRMLYEANEVLSTILASYPLHVVARTCRMVIYEYLFLQQADDPVMAEKFFLRATAEVAILERYHAEEAEIYMESGLVYYSRAVQLINNLRKARDKKGRAADVEEIKKMLKRSVSFFNRGTAMLATVDLRAETCKRMAKTLQEMMEIDATAVISNQPIVDEQDIIYNVAIAQYKELGWLKNNTPEEQDAFFSRLSNVMVQFSEKSSVTNWSPSIKCISASQFWSILPSVNVLIVKTILAFYGEAIKEAELLSKYGIGIYESSGAYTYIQTPEHFIQNARKFIDLLMGVVKDDLDKADDYIIDRDKIRRLALPFVLLDDKIESDIICKN